MEIIREGNLKHSKKPIRFICKICDCIFIADNTEYQYCGCQIEGDEWKCKCPACNKVVYSTLKMGW